MRLNTPAMPAYFRNMGSMLCGMTSISMSDGHPSTD
jgi:hypothetical protein